MYTAASMLELIRQNSNMISVIANVGTLAVWVFYAQLLYNGYRRERRPRVLINKDVGSTDSTAACLICNMSKEPIFVEGIFVSLETSIGSFLATATDTEQGVNRKQAGPGPRTMQGPIDSGECIEVRTFSDFISRAADAGGLPLTGDRPQDPDVVFFSLTVTVVSIYGSEDHPFGVTREFELHQGSSDRIRLNPSSIDTKRLTARTGKKHVKELLRRFM